MKRILVSPSPSRHPLRHFSLQPSFVQKHGAIQVSGQYNGESPVVLREVGTSRTMFVLEPHLSCDAIQATAERMRLLTTNEGISSVMVTSGNVASEGVGLPLSTEMRDASNELVDFPLNGGLSLDHIFGGYDALSMFRADLHKDKAAVEELMESVAYLAASLRGGEASRIPVLTLPHGLISDAGYAFCMGGYVLATRNSTFRISNPSCGLSLDPIGFSFFLPRLGWEQKLASADFPGCGLLLALTGFEASASDMMETGLATHYIESPVTAGMLERSLSNLPPWSQQGLVKDKPRYHGQPPSQIDVNAQFRNLSLANLVHAFSNYDAKGVDMFTNRDSDFFAGSDASVDTDFLPWHEKRESNLVNIAASFDEIFEEKTLVGLRERLKEVSSRHSDDPEELEGINVARDILKRMENQSPLALHTTFALMQHGGRDDATLDACVAREKNAQRNLFAMEDFEQWAKLASSENTGSTPVWKHSGIGSVHPDQVAEIIEGT